MAFDGLYLSAITQELKNQILDTRADKVHQPEKDEVILSFRGREGVKKLLLTSSADSARAHLTEESKQNPKEAPLFTMVMRKYVQGGKLIAIRQPGGDRILELTFSTTDEMGFHSNYLLISEMMGRHSNILLVRERDMKIMESIKHIGADVNTYRILLPGATYILPPPQDKLDPASFSDEELAQRLTEPLGETDFAAIFSGISRQTAQVLYRVYERIRTGDPTVTAVQGVRLALGEAFGTDTYFVFLKDDRPRDLSLLLPPEEFLDQYDEIEEFTSPSLALEFFIGEKDKSNRVRERSQDILRVVSANLDRVGRKIKILQEVLAEAAAKDDYRIRGELLKANLYALKDGLAEARLVNYYDEAQAELTVALDEHKTITENMQAYFNKYNKLKRSEENAREQLLLAEDEENYLNSVADSVMRSEDPSDIAEIRQELIVAGYIRYKSTKKKKESPSKPMRFRSSEGVTIYVGKNNNQNDYLTTKLADDYDTWLHTKNYPGSHVIIKGRAFSEETLLEAANLAAWYSKAQAGTKVPVDYTLVRYVKKPSGSKPGMVIYTTNKTIYIDPGAPRLERF